MKMSNKLYITNLSPETTELELREIFVKIGPVLSVHIPIHPGTGLQKDYGFVEMETLELALAAAQSMNDHILHDQKLQVSKVPAPTERKTPPRADLRPIEVRRPQPRTGPRRSK
jgi:RNA recognition motif-containing protein